GVRRLLLRWLVLEVDARGPCLGVRWRPLLWPVLLPLRLLSRGPGIPPWALRWWDARRRWARWAALKAPTGHRPKQLSGTWRRRGIRKHYWACQHEDATKDRAHRAGRADRADDRPGRDPPQGAG